MVLISSMIKFREEVINAAAAAFFQRPIIRSSFTLHELKS